MPHVGQTAPGTFPGVMVSSTYGDFVRHRVALIRAINGQGMHAVAMEYDAALPDDDVISSSLRMVRESAAYIVIIGTRYGNVPDSPDQNPDGWSLTELEFREARKIGLPILLFIMGAEHDVKERDVELDPGKRRKLEAFREEAKSSVAGSRVHRVYSVFNSLNDFEVAATQSVAELRRLLDGRTQVRGTDSQAAVAAVCSGSLPTRPALYAVPRYIGSHAFVGRTAELKVLNGWATPAEPDPVLLFEAIGGTGKSMLTWQWVTHEAPGLRDDWAGVFWYSFYEKGAGMADFCRRALAYMTGQPADVLGKKKQPELTELLTQQLRQQSWLLILDGLERILVSYHRYDAAQLPDELAGNSDEIAHRDPCCAIRPLDDDLLRQLPAASPSKILITSRLVPRVLLNPAHQPVPGAAHVRLRGLHPADAEALLRTCGVTGDSERMRDYLLRHCDCHPLVTGVVAGLINDYLPARGDFDRWAADPDAGGWLDLAHRSLTHKRNHILAAALRALPEASWRLLSTLSLLSESFDYAMLAALNPHLTLAGRAAVPEAPTAAAELSGTVRDLEERGLLQYDHQARRWDLHPVVRAVVSGRLGDRDRDRFGQRIVDYFSQRSGNPYARAETLDDLRDGVTVATTLLQMGRKREAWDAIKNELLDALFYNVEAYPEALELLQPFFPRDWSTAHLVVREPGSLANRASVAYWGMGEVAQSMDMTQKAIGIQVAARNWERVVVNLANLSADACGSSHLAVSDRCSALALRLAEALDSPEGLFSARRRRFEILAVTGRWDRAEAMWSLLDSMGRDWHRRVHRPGDAEYRHAELLLFPRDRLTEAGLAAVENLAHAGQNRKTLRLLGRLRGQWRLCHGEYDLAVESLQDAVQLARAAGILDPGSETLLALARFRREPFPDATEEAQRLSVGRDPAHGPLAELWRVLGDTGQAIWHARAAYKQAWADGEPHVSRYELDSAAALLRELGVDVPVLADFNPAGLPAYPWEAAIDAVIKGPRRYIRHPKNHSC